MFYNTKFRDNLLNRNSSQNRENALNLIKVIRENLQLASYLFHGEILIISPCSWEKDKAVHSTTLFSFELEVLARAISQGKEIIVTKIGKEEEKCPSFIDDVTVYVKKSKRIYKKKNELMNEFSNEDQN